MARRIYPRKFKVGFVLPPLNDVDIFAQDIGFIAIVEGERLLGYNVAIGGGQGMSHGNVENLSAARERHWFHYAGAGYSGGGGGADDAA